MDGITELAMLFKSRENGAAYTPMFGKIISLPNVKIQIAGGDIVIDSSYIVSLVNLAAINSNEDYVNLNKTVVLLPYAEHQKFIVIGVVQ